MGDIADAMLDGTLCATCGEFIGESSGIPGYCCLECEPPEYTAAKNSEVGQLMKRLKDTLFPEGEPKDVR